MVSWTYEELVHDLDDVRERGFIEVTSHTREAEARLQGRQAEEESSGQVKL